MKKTAIISFVLCLCMVLSLVGPGVAAFASANEAFPGAGGNTSDSVAGGSDADRPAGGNTSDSVAGGDNADRPAGGNTSDSVAGGDNADRPAGGDTSDSVAGGDNADRPAGGDTSDSVAGGDNADRPAGGETPVVEKVTLTIKSWEIVPYETTADKVAVNQEGLTAADWSLIIYTSDFKGACVEAGWGLAIVVKDGKIVRAYDGTAGTFYDATHNAATNAGCTTGGYAKEAFDSMQDGEMVIIAPNSPANNTQPGSRWYVHRYGRGIGNEVVLEGVTFPAPEQPAGNAGVIEGATTDTYTWQDEYEFTAPATGKYTFTVPAGLGVHNKEIMMSNPWAAPYVDFNMDMNGGTFTLEMTEGQKVTFVLSAATKDNWSIAWAVETAEGGEGNTEAANAVIGENTVVVTDVENGTDLTFVVEQAATFTFESNDLLVIIFDANGMMIGRVMAYLEPGTYTLKCINLAGETGTFAMNIVAEYPEEEEPAGTSGTIEGATTDTYTWQDEYVFTAPATGKYTFTVPAGLGVHNKEIMMSNPWAAPYVDFNMDMNGGTFTLELNAGQSVTLVLSAATKDTWVITWTAEITEEPAKPTSGTIEGATTDTYTWQDEYEFTAPVAGKYTFTVPAGLGVHNKEIMMSNPWAAPYVDFNMDMNGGTFTLEMTEGQKVTFVLSAATKDNWSIAWEVEVAEEGGEVVDTNAVIGQNTVVITDGDSGAEMTFVVEKAGTYKFASNDVMIRVLDANGMMLFMGQGYLEPGTYTLQCYAMGSTGSFKFTIEAEFAPEITNAVLGENFVTIENGDEGAMVTFVVEAAGTYKFASNSVMVKVLDANGMMLFMGQGYLQPGTYTLQCYAMGLTGSFSYTITTDAFDAPSLEIGENTVEITDAETGVEFEFTPYEDGTYKFEIVNDGVYLIAIVRDANGDIVGRNEVPMTAGTTYTVSFMVTNDDAEGQVGEFVVNVSKMIEAEGTIIEELPGSMTGNAGDDLIFSYVATEDCIVDLVIVAGNPLITLPNGEEYEEIENGKRIALKAGDILVINPWNSAEAFEITISIFDPETLTGGAKNPVEMDNTKNETVNLQFPASEGYHFTWTAAKDGKVTFALNVLENMEGKQILVNGTVLTMAVKSVTIDVLAGDVITIICSADTENSIMLDVNFQEKTEEPTQPTDPQPTEPTTPATKPSTSETKPTTGTTQPTTGNAGETEEPANNTLIIVIIAVVIVAGAVVAVVVLKKKK